MTTTLNRFEVETKTLLSTLWIFVLLNMIMRDIHELLRPGFLAEIMTGVVNGNQMTEGFLLMAGVLLQIPLLMVVLSRVLNYKTNRRANIAVGTLTAISIVVNGVNDLDDVFFALVEAAALAVIVWAAWKWRPQTVPAESA